jgi:periplasmic divalent cation tolerance protein
METSRYGIVLVTAASQAEAESIADALVTAQLAACVSMMPIRSVYTWKGEVCRDQEWQLVIKTHLDHFADLETKIRAIHSYETPEIIAIPIVAGSQPYLDWISAQVQFSKT